MAKEWVIKNVIMKIPVRLRPFAPCLMGKRSTRTAPFTFFFGFFLPTGFSSRKSPSCIWSLLTASGSWLPPLTYACSTLFDLKAYVTTSKTSCQVEKTRILLLWSWSMSHKILLTIASTWGQGRGSVLRHHGWPTPFFPTVPRTCKTYKPGILDKKRIFAALFYTIVLLKSDGKL